MTKSDTSSEKIIHFLYAHEILCEVYETTFVEEQENSSASLDCGACLVACKAMFSFLKPSKNDVVKTFDSFYDFFMFLKFKKISI